MRPEVSVIVPCYNYGHFLAETLESVRLQTFQNWECIVVDDGSVDNSREVILTFVATDTRIKYIYQENRGSSAARNAGIRAAKGAFLQFLDADDLIEKRKLELQVSFLSGNPDIDIVYGSVRYFTTEQPGLRLFFMKDDDPPWMPNVSGKGTPIISALIKSNIMVVSAPLVSRSVITHVGYFDETLRFCEDYEYWLRCSISEIAFHYIDHPDVRTLVRCHSTSMSKNRLEMLKANLSILNSVRNKLFDGEILQLLDKSVCNINIELLLEKMRKGGRFKGFIGIADMSIRVKNMRSFLFGLMALFLGVRLATAISSYLNSIPNRNWV
jgi:glycosyltransferase involved in cell wall biosynthesis